MQPTPVRVGVMDSSRPGLVATLPVRALAPPERAWRGLKRALLVSAIGLVLVPVPLMHACGAAILFVAGPIAGYFAWRHRVVFGVSEVPCAKCSQPLPVKEGLSGWPARVHCQRCGAMVELNEAPAA